VVSALRATPPAARVGVALTRGSGLLAAALNCAFLLQGLTRSRLPVANSLISELEARDQPGSALFRAASLLAGLLTIALAAGVRRRLPPGALGGAGCAALALSGLSGVVDALLRMDCAPSVDLVCRRHEQFGALSWPHQLHTWSSVLEAAALLASLWLLGRHLRAAPGWRRISLVGTVGGGALIAYSGVVTVMAAYYLPGVGLAQRFQVLAFSAWLAALALATPASRTG
jgi:hypothetical protein